MVASAGRDADERNACLRDGGDQRLGAVAARHADHVGATGHGTPRELQEVDAEPEHDGLDPRRSALPYQVELLRLPAARLRVHDQRAVAGRPDRFARSLAQLERAHIALQRVACQEEREDKQRQAHQQ